MDQLEREFSKMIGEKIRALRDQAGLTDKDLATSVGRSEAAIRA